MIEIKNLTKYYGKKKAVDNICFDAKDGEIVGFLGPNGAGKSTTMSIISGYLSYTEGSVKIDGIEVVEEPIAIKKKIGYLPEQPPLYTDMTVEEYLKFVYELKKVNKNKDAHVSQILETVGIKNVGKRLIRNLSKGYRQRVGLAQALIGDPEILILDEPTSGLDPKQIIEARNVIKKLGETKTVILSSHILSEINAVCERVVIINKGRIVAEDTPENLAKKENKKQTLTVRIGGDRDTIVSVLKGVPGLSIVRESGQKEPESFDFLIEAASGMDIRRSMCAQLARHSLPILMLENKLLSLEDIFIQLTEDGTEKKL